MNAEEHLAEVKRLATAQLKAAKLAARNANMVLVDAKRLETLEAIASSLVECIKTANMTRDYADVKDKIGYHGKMWLLERFAFEEVYRHVNDLKNVSGPAGCMARD